MKSILLAGAAALLISGAASAQGYGSTQYGASGNDARNTTSMTAQSDTMSGQRSVRSERRVEQRRATSSSRRSTRPEDQAYMGGGMILENGRPVDMGGAPMGGAAGMGVGGMSAPGGFMPGSGMVGQGQGGSAGFRPDTSPGGHDGQVTSGPRPMGSSMMPGGTGTGRAAGTTPGGGR